MLCILCISESDEMLHIFDQRGIDLNISNIITKHFWLQPNAGDSNAICCSCWNTVESFHSFYKSIEEAHNRLTCLKHDKDESTHSETFSDLFTTVVKEENSNEAEFNLPEISQKSLIQPIDAADEEKEILDSDSESEVPLVELCTRKKSMKENKYKKSSAHESDLDNASTDSDYTIPKKNIKIQVSSTAKDLGKHQIPCKEFDSFIKKNMELVCNICTKPQENFFTLKEHFKKIHKRNGFVTCCDMQWTSRFSLVHHLLLHQNPDLFKCQKCGRVLANKKSFQNHMKSHVTQEQIHQCAKCKKLFSSIPKLQRHLNTHFRTDTDQICDQCGKVYHNKQILKAHQKREHLGFVKQRVQCTKCGVYLGDLSTLKFHTKHLHPKIKVVNACNICGKVSATAYGLKRHIKYMHTMERVHKCSICEDKAFKTAQILREHMTTHTGEVLYTCPHCPKTFNSNANMHSHRKKMHRKEWEENRRHPHMGASANANNVTEENNQQ